MAQTKKKRRSKHRGNAAGSVEARGRTGRPPRPGENKASAGAQVKRDRLSKPPTWRSSAIRAALTAAVLFPILLLVLKAKPVTAVVMSFLAFGVYVPMSYYTDLWVFRRRERKRTA
jgi:uncharacterized integral membrane protein